jgi:hypothetical protein
MILLSDVWNSETGWWLAIIIGIIYNDPNISDKKRLARKV